MTSDAPPTSPSCSRNRRLVVTPASEEVDFFVGILSSCRLSRPGGPPGTGVKGDLAPKSARLGILKGNSRAEQRTLCGALWQVVAPLFRPVWRPSFSVWWPLARGGRRRNSRPAPTSHADPAYFPAASSLA